ncbi:hypothetical protein KY309_00550 [Candidatus Woesearchaeota archaeon]|nr:hypothetical protein [Candidatus Woesearchaeota archaeon]
MEWFKRLFYQKKTLEEVKNWLQEELEKHEKQQQDTIKAAEQEMPDLLISAKEETENLEKAELRNPNVPERAKHYMQGNREQFIKLTNKFLENLFIPKDETDTSQLNLLFHQYAQNITRPSAILTEFFGEEVKKIRGALAKIEEKIVEIRKIQTQKQEIEKIKEKIQTIENIEKEQEEIKKQKEEYQEKLQQATNKRETLKKEKEEFTSRPEYLKIKEDIVSSAKERQEAEQEITGLFLALSDPIKKYAHKTKNAKIAKYAEQPLDALIKDYSLSILKHKKELENAITKGELELKPERTQKALEALKQLTKEKLSEMIHRYAKAKKREADVHNDVADRPVMKEYEQYAIELKTITTDIEQIEKTIAKLTLPDEKPHQEELKKELQKFKITLTL